MNSNGSNMMNDYMNEMEKYTKKEKVQEVSIPTSGDATNFTTQSSNFGNSNPNSSGVPMDKEKLFESFMMFMNAQQRMTQQPQTNPGFDNMNYFGMGMNSNYNIMNVQPSNIGKQKENTQHTSNAFNDYLNNDDYGDDDDAGKGETLISNLSFEKNNINVNKTHSTKGRTEIKEEPIHNNVFTLDNNQQEYNANIEEPTNQQPKSFDDVPIKPKASNFMELLEQNLANDNGEMNYDSGNKPKRVIEYKPRPRRSEMLNISQPGEAKKYKYYSQNFNKDFGKSPDPGDVIEEPPKEETKPDKKSGKIYGSNRMMIKNKSERNVRGKSATALRPATVNTQESRLPNKNNSSAANNKLPINNKKPIVESANIWEDLKEVNKLLSNEDAEDDFLNAYSKPTNKNKITNPIPISQNPPTKQVQNSTRIESKKEELEIKMVNQNKPNIIKTQTKLNPLTEQIIQMKKENSNERSPNASRISKSESFQEKVSSKFDVSEMNNSDQEKDEDEDDDRDIIKMYEQQYKSTNLPTENKLESDYNRDEELNNKQSLYRKPEQQKIINKYFKPLIAAKETKSNQDVNQQEEKRNNMNTNVNDIVGEKIEELNKEIEKIKKENEKVTKLKSEYEKLTKKVGREITDFYQKKEKEMQEFEQWKEEEMKKIEKERKMHARNTKLLQNMPNRKEREEIDSLKEQVLKLQEEMKAKDQRNKLAMDRLKKQLEEANKKNEDLQKEVRFMEELRVKNMLNNPKNNQQKVGDNKKATQTAVTPSLTSNKSAKNILPASSVNNKPQQANQINSTVQNKKPVSVPQSSKVIDDNFSSDENEDHEKEVKDDEFEMQESMYNNYNTYNMNAVTSNQFGNNEEDNLEIKMNKVKVIKTKKEQNRFEDNYSAYNTNMNTHNLTSSPNTASYANQNTNQTVPVYNKKQAESSSKLSSTNNSTGKKTLPSSKTNSVSNFQQNVQTTKEEENFDLVFPDKYHGKAAKNVRLMKHDVTEDGKIIKLYENMKKEILFPSGVRKEIFEDGYSVTYFANKDIKQVFPDTREVYLFFENKTLQFKFPDGLQVFKFDGGQVEKHYPDGTKVVNYTDGTIRNVYPDGYEETFFTDGSLQKVDKSGVITIDYEDGIKDTIYPDGTKIREFPDGRVKKILPDKSMENYRK